MKRWWSLWPAFQITSLQLVSGLLGDSYWDFFGTGTIIDCLKHVGITDCERERLNISVLVCQRRLWCPEMSSVPAAFLAFTLLKAILMLCSVMLKWLSAQTVSACRLLLTLLALRAPLASWAWSAAASKKSVKSAFIVCFYPQTLKHAPTWNCDSSFLP